MLVGWQTRWAALALALFAVVAAVFYHYLPAQGLEGYEAMAQILNFQKNFAIAGGFLALAAFGPGGYSSTPASAAPRPTPDANRRGRKAPPRYRLIPPASVGTSSAANP